MYENWMDSVFGFDARISAEDFKKNVMKPPKVDGKRGEAKFIFSTSALRARILEKAGCENLLV